MATLKVVGSGSQQGNTYIIEAGGEHLLLDLGCKYNDIMEGLNHNVSKCYALVTHLHGDHSKSIKQILQKQIPIYSNEEVSEKYKGVKALQPKVRYKIGGFIVQPLEVQHNCQNFAFIIEHEEIGKIVFVTDAISFPYKVKGCSHLLIEGNYSEDLIIDNLCKNETIRSHNEYHMEISKTIEAIKRNMNPELKKIVLIHLSDGQSDERMFQKMVFEEVGIMPIVADKGVEISLDRFDF